MKYLLSFILSIFILSCTPFEKENTATYFGGEILNPKSDFVLFLKDDIAIDTFFLNNNNRFLAKFNNLKEGLYTFKHGLEFQYIYLEPADSLLVRLNTWDFDESIVFTGKGSSKNDFLINLFLQNENEEKTMYQYFKLDENDFQAKLDSLLLERKNNYKNFVENEPDVSEGFDHLINFAINLPLYRLKEAYPYYHKGAHHLKKFPKVSGNFYNFRNSINLNESSLLSFYPYQNYLMNYLYNISHQLKEKDSTKSDITINVLNAVIDNINSEVIKNTLLKRIIINDFMKAQNTCSINNEKLSIFLANCTNEAYIHLIQNLVNDSKFVKNKQPLPNFDIVSYNNTENNIREVINHQNAVIYFWSSEYMSIDYLVSRVNFLKRKHPNTLFIGIQMQPAFLNATNEPTLKKLDINKQYKLTSNSAANNFLTSRYPRTIIVNSEGNVLNGFTFLDSNNLSKELNKLH